MNNKLKQEPETPTETNNSNQLQPQPEPRPSFAVRLIGTIFCLVLVLICLYGFVAMFTGCAAQESEPELSELELHPFVAAKLSYDDAEAAADKLYELCLKQPEVLASTISAFPSMVEELEYLKSTEPDHIDDFFDQEGGGKVQQELVMQLIMVIAATDTEFVIGNYTGEAEVLYMVERTKDAKAPEDFGLVWSTTTLVDEPILGIAYGDIEHREFGYYVISGGFQRMIPTLGGLG